MIAQNLPFKSTLSAQFGALKDSHVVASRHLVRRLQSFSSRQTQTLYPVNTNSHSLLGVLFLKILFINF